MQDELLVADGKKWEFDGGVATVFDDMLERSIPQYDLMRELTYRIGEHYVVDNTAIIDIGCSRGQAIRPFVESHSTANNYLCIDVSEPMLDACRMNFEDCPTVSVERYDLKFGIPARDGCASVVLAILTIQFTPIEYRQKILGNIYDKLADGGALIIVEKVLGQSLRTDDLITSEYYRMKRDNRYTQEQIEAKKKSLEGVLTPITAKWNEDIIKAAGFRHLECFWRCLNFAGWVAIK